MQETRPRQKFENYDLEKAFSLLGPKNHGSFSPQSLSDHLIIIIQNFVKTFFRTINFIFGDHQWYNNQTSHELLVKYYRNPAEAPKVAAKIDCLYNELLFRGTGYFRSFSSIADDLHEVRRTYLNNINLANQGDQAIANPIDQLISQPINPSISQPIIQPIPQPINQTIDQVEEPNNQPDDHLIDPSVSQIYSNQDEISIDDSDDQDELISYIKVPNPPRKSYPLGIQQCGNLSMQSVFEDWKKMASDLGDEITDAQILKLVQDAEEDLINYQPQLFPNKKVSKEKAIKAYQNLADFLSPRRSPIGEEQINTHFDQRYLQAYDPYELFSLASFIAIKELKISGLNSKEYDRSKDWFSVFKLTVFNLISQAELRTDACGAHGGQYLNINNSTFSHTRYQKPIIVYKQSNDGSYEPQTLFNTDLFSSTYVGCDPDGAKRLMHKLQEKNKLNQFKNSFLKMNPFNDFKPDSDEAILCDLLTTIAEQIRDRYGVKMMPMIDAFSQGKKLLAGKSFENLTLSPNRSFENEISYDSYVNSAQTPYQLFLLSFIWSTQKLASAGLINKKDKWGEALAIFKKVVCCEALLNILYKATIQDEFTVKLSDHITLPCGKFFAHEPSEENPNILVAVEHFIENELSGKLDNDDPSSDLISIISMISKFSPEEKNLFLNYYSVNYLKSLYALKGIQENEMVDVIKIKADFEHLPDERKEAFKSLAAELSVPLNRLDEKYFRWMGAPIWENVKLLKNALPSILNRVKEVPNEEKIKQPIQFEYLDAEFHELVTFQNAPLCNEPPKALIQDWNKVQGSSQQEKIVTAIGKQYLIISNDTMVGNCMYGALSRVIFGKNVDNSKVDYFSRQLRKAAAKYMRDHKDQFTPHMYKSSDKKNPKETNEDYEKRLKPILEKRFVTYCSDLENTYEYGTDLEMMAISDIFGVEIQVFNAQRSCQIVDGIIQPNARVGNHYEGKQPIRLIFVNGNHFRPLVPIT